MLARALVSETCYQGIKFIGQLLSFLLLMVWVAGVAFLLILAEAFFVLPQLFYEKE